MQRTVLAIKSVLGQSNVDEDFVFTEDINLFQTGLDLSSIDGVLLAVKMEELFGIKWPNEYLAFDDTLTIGQVLDIITQCLVQNEGGV